MQLCKKDARKEKRVKVKSLKRLSKKGRSDGTLGDTTEDILRQCRSVLSPVSLAGPFCHGHLARESSNHREEK